MSFHFSQNSAPSRTETKKSIPFLLALRVKRSFSSSAKRKYPMSEEVNILVTDQSCLSEIEKPGDSEKQHSGEG